MLEIVTFTLGPAMTNAYLVADLKPKNGCYRPCLGWPCHPDRSAKTGLAYCSHVVHARPLRSYWRRGSDCGCSQSASAGGPASRRSYALASEGGAPFFGFKIDPGPEPTIDLQHGQILKLGSIEFEVRFTPGHTPGMCIFYVASEGICFCGDLIFRDSVGRTDLPGGDWGTLLKSIHEQVFTLSDETRLLSGHGPETTVGEEKQSNPYVGN